MEPELIWPNARIGVNILFKKIPTLTRVWYIISSKRVTVQTENSNEQDTNANDL